MKIVFVYMGWENLGIEYLSSYLGSHGHKTSLVFDPALFNDQIMFDIPFLARLFDQTDAIVNQVVKEKPDMVCFSVITNNYQWALKIAGLVKQKLNIPIVFGGHHATTATDEVLSHKFIDFVIIGEAEEALLELADCLESRKPFNKIQNLAYVKDSKKMINPVRPLIEDISKLPFPDKDLFAKYIPINKEYMFLSSRGCPFGCTYCCNNYYRKLYKGKGRYVRRCSVDYLIEELKIMRKKYRFRRVLTADDVFTSDIGWLKRFRDRYVKEVNLPMFVVSHPRYLSEEVIRILKDCRCYYIEIGVQTINMRIKKDIIKRFENNEDVIKVIGLCKKYKIKCNVDHIFGFPTQTEQDMKNAARFYSVNKPARITFYQLSYFPATEIVDISKSHGMIDDSIISDMYKGNDRMYFSGGSLRKKEDLIIARNYDIFFKLIALLPRKLLLSMLRKDMQKNLHRLPSIFTLFLNFLILLKNWEVRGFDYIYYYAKNMPRVVYNKAFKS